MVLKTPPALQFAVCAVLMRGLAEVPVAALRLPSAGGWVVLPIAAGLAVWLAGLYEFRRVGTTANPVYPDKVSHLVGNGIYRYSRNPMYLGLVLVLAAWALRLEHVLAWLGLPLFVVGMNRLQIMPEEQVLADKFGDEYRNYCRRVRRWL